jgi:hypothetical protein
MRYQVSCHVYVLMANYSHFFLIPENFSMPLGDERFKPQVEQILGRKSGYTGKDKLPWVAGCH